MELFLILIILMKQFVIAAIFTFGQSRLANSLRNSEYGMREFHGIKDTYKLNLSETKEIFNSSLFNQVQILGKNHQFSFANEDV